MSEAFAVCAKPPTGAAWETGMGVAILPETWLDKLSAAEGRSISWHLQPVRTTSIY